MVTSFSRDDPSSSWFVVELLLLLVGQGYGINLLEETSMVTFQRSCSFWYFVAMPPLKLKPSCGFILLKGREADVDQTAGGSQDTGEGLSVCLSGLGISNRLAVCRSSSVGLPIGRIQSQIYIILFKRYMYLYKISNVSLT